MHGGWSSNPNERINPFTKPAEGKFQVKDDRARSVACEAISVLECTSNQ